MADIRHVVVLMLENRSFDHLLEFLGPEFPGQAFEGLVGNESIPSDPRIAGSATVPVAESDSDDIYIASIDPGHEYDDVCLQLFGTSNITPGTQPTNAGFVCSYSGQKTRDGEPYGIEVGKTIMRCVAPERLPVIAALAQNFVVCDHWFSSVPGPTWPNRFFIHAATAGGHIESPTNAEAIRTQIWSPHRMRTIYENLADAGRSWKIYFHDVAHAFALQRLHQYADDFEWFYPRPESTESFLEAAAAGKLPDYSFIEPQYFSTPGNPANDQHPPHDLRHGERLIATVYDALRDNNPVWQHCLFILLYDEHGGFYDHVKPPTAVSPDGLKAKNGFDFTRLGVRVPAILISPWLPKGRVDQTVYDHTSVLATLKKLYNLPRFLTARDAAANTFERNFLNAPRADAPTGLMDLRKVAPPSGLASGDLQLSEYQRSLEALSNVLAAPRNEHEAARRIDTRVQTFLSRIEAP